MRRGPAATILLLPERLRVMLAQAEAPMGARLIGLIQHQNDPFELVSPKNGTAETVLVVETEKWRNGTVDIPSG